MGVDFVEAKHSTASTWVPAPNLLLGLLEPRPKCAEHFFGGPTPLDRNTLALNIPLVAWTSPTSIWGAEVDWLNSVSPRRMTRFTKGAGAQFPAMVLWQWFCRFVGLGSLFEPLGAIGQLGKAIQAKGMGREREALGWRDLSGPSKGPCPLVTGIARR